METLIVTKYQWRNKLSYEDRDDIVRLYLSGYGIEAIAIHFFVSNSTIQYHLKKTPVYVPNTKPTLFRNQNEIQPRHQLFTRTLHEMVKQDTKEYYYDEWGEKYMRPKSYKQILRKQRAIERRKKIKPHKPKETGYIVRVTI